MWIFSVFQEYVIILYGGIHTASLYSTKTLFIIITVLKTTIYHHNRQPTTDNRRPTTLRTITSLPYHILRR